MNKIYCIIITILIGFVLWAFTSLSKMVYYDDGFIDAKTQFRLEAIKAGVAEYVIVDKMTGKCEFMWKTNGQYIYIANVK